MIPRNEAPLAVDMPLLSAIAMLCAVSLVVLYSASGEDLSILVRQGARIGFAFLVMLFFTRVPPPMLASWSPILYGAGLLLLGIVLIAGFVGGGARRWLDLGVLRFQPSEIMKLAVPMMVAWILTRASLPPRPLVIFIALFAVLLPCTLVMAQPDLGTAVLIAVGGIMAIFFAGIGWKLILTAMVALGGLAPMLWFYVLHDYQRRRIQTLLDPWEDPLGAGYHTIQSIIAVGAGGVGGKGWLAGTQSRLDFIPEQGTDFIFAVYAEEFGFIGALLLLLLYLFAAGRGLAIAINTNDRYSRLLGGCLSFTFFLYAFVNIAMATGILPVVGVPLPLLSHGGSSMVTLMIGFGILMSIHRHKNVLRQL